MTDPQPTRAQMIRLTLRGSSSLSAHGLPGRFASCVLDPLGQTNPWTHVDRESVI